ncbi:uncharacterized protein [Haliotis asinina]|uniref:uncharacterized protein isoform X2 n=1 Tax=Haliotis asinina TaxID=109174 RepID=UPI003531F9B7
MERILQFHTNEEGYNMPEFFDRYSKRMPVFAVVTQGCLGLTDLETFASEQPLFCHSYVKQRRVVARDSRGRTISIPEDYPMKFKIVISRSKVGPEQTMKEILRDNKLPVQVKFAAPSNVAFYVGSDRQQAKDLSNLALSRIYEEAYILASGVYGLKGVVGMKDEEWKTMYAGLEQSLKDIKVPPNLGNNEIAVFSDSTVVDKEDHIYSYLEPTEYITYSLLSQDHVRGAEKYATPYFHKRHPPKGSLISELQRKLKTTKTEGIAQRWSVAKVARSVSTSSEDTTCKPTLPSRSISVPEDAGAVNENQLQRTVTGNTAVPELPPRKGSTKHVAEHLKDLTIEGFSKALKELKLVKHVSTFRNHQVDGTLANEFTIDVLKTDFKLTGFESVKLMKFIKTGHIPRH